MNKKNIILYLMLSGLAMLPGMANAALAVGTATNLSATKNIPYTQATSVTIRWSMNWSGITPVTVSSASGSFYDSTFATLLGTVPKGLSKSSSILVSNFKFTETVRIPRAVLFKAYRQGFRQIGYRRTFNDGTGPLVISIVYTVTGSAAGAFGVSGYSLRFSDGSLATIVQQQQPLTAEARISVSGVGTLKGVWEAALPGSSSGTPFYASLQMITRQVSSGQLLRLRSPALPTNLVGNHLVRFRLLQPGLSSDPPALQYFVGSRSPVKLGTINVVSPSNNVVIDGNTQFQWQAVGNANSYKIEIIADQPPTPTGPVVPVTGMLLKAANRKATLKPSMLRKLKPNSKYWWHVLALDKNGQIMAASNWQKLRTH